MIYDSVMGLWRGYEIPVFMLCDTKVKWKFLLLTKKTDAGAGQETGNLFGVQYGL